MAGFTVAAPGQVVVQHRARPHFPASWSTRIVRNSQFPAWHEAHTFQVVSTGPVLVHLRVWDYDFASHDDFLGETALFAPVAGPPFGTYRS